MSKHGWTYKKLGEVCMIERGGSPRPIQNFITDAEDGVNWIKIGDAVDGSKYISSTKEKIKPEGVKKSRFVHAGDFILSNSMSFGKPYILQIDGCIHDGWLVIRDENNTFIKDFLYYYLSSPKLYRTFKMLAVGGVVNNLNSKLVRNIDVMMPPMAEQEAIVAELDEINEAIAALQQQVADLDTLAQSTFCDMFGDPVTNPKAWPVKKLGELSTVKTGPFGSMLHKEDYIVNGIPLVNPVHMRNFKIVPDMSFTIPEHKAQELSNYLLRSNDIVFARRGDIGRCAVVSKEQEGFLCGTGSLFVRFNENVDSVFTMYVIRSESFTNSLLSAAKGATMLNINSTVVENLNFILPPLSLQQEFAEKVEAIEAAKAELNALIAEMQTLLASRMDYYFD